MCLALVTEFSSGQKIVVGKPIAPSDIAEQYSTSYATIAMQTLPIVSCAIILYQKG